MKIKEVEEKKPTSFEKLATGATFMQGGTLYLKIDEDYAPGCYSGAAVELETGEIRGFDNEELISPKECEILVYPI